MNKKDDTIFTVMGMLIFLRNDIEHNLSTPKDLIWLINHIIKLLERL